MNIYEYDILTRLRSAVSVHCWRTARARIRQLATFRNDHYDIPIADTVAELVTEYIPHDMWRELARETKYKPNTRQL